MNRAWLEEQIRVGFGFQEAALVAALHEVQACFESPVYYTAILQMYPTKRPMERFSDSPPLKASNG